MSSLDAAAAARACSSRCSRARRRTSWGIGDIGDIEPLDRVARRRRPARPAAAAAQRDGAGPAVAVLGDQRDGDRSDLHPRAATCRSSPRSAAKPRSAPTIASALARCAGAPRIELRDVRAAEAARRCAPRSSAFSSASGARDTARAPRAAGRTSASRRGGSRTTRCSARSTRASSERPWTEWPDGAAAARARRRSIARAASSPTKCCSSSICSGSPAAQWQRRRARRRTASRCSAICRSWSTATAPTCGRGSISSASTCRSARRPTRSAPPGRTGACRSIGGTRSRPRITAGCASARAAAPICSTATASIISSASTGPTARPQDGGEPFFTPADEPAQRALGETRARAVPRAPAPRSSPRISAPFPISCARRWRVSASRVSCASAGSGTGTTTGQPFRDPAGLPASLGGRVRHARHRADGRLVGCSATDEERATGRARSPIGAAPHRRRRSARRAVRRRRCATCCSKSLFASGSDLLLLPMQDAFGWRDRINEPATVSDENWTYRLPWPVDQLDEIPEARERQERLRAWSELR